MEQQRLERDKHYTINAWQADRLELWESQYGDDRQNLNLKDNGGNDVFTLFKLTRDQLADLYLEIARVLRKPPDPTLHHLKQIHSSIGKLIHSVEPREENLGEEEDYST
jgi:hypothetical protein